MLADCSQGEIEGFIQMNALGDSILRKTQKEQRKTKAPYPDSVNQHQCH